MPGTDTSNISAIVDASAAVAAAYVNGLSYAYGIGGGAVVIPSDGSPGILAGQTVGGFTGVALETMTHVSDLPDAPKITDYSADVTEIMWRVPMRLNIARNDQGNARLQAIPFYSRYLVAFAKHATLLGTCNSAEITSFDLFHDNLQSGWLGIAMILSVWERLDIGFLP